MASISCDADKTAFFKAFKNKCCVNNCSVLSANIKTHANTFLYRFPTNDDLFKKWCHNLQLDFTNCKYTSSRVCSRHFESEFIGKKKLISGAVPTLFLGHEGENIFFSKKEKEVGLQKCCVPHCDGTARNSTLFSFPKDEEQRKSWIKICKIEFTKKKILFICRKHFDSKFLGVKKLRKGAFPTMNLDNSIENENSISVNDKSRGEGMDVYKFEDSHIGNVIMPTKVYDGPASKNIPCYQDFTLKELNTIKSPLRKRKSSNGNEEIACVKCTSKQENVEYFRNINKASASKCIRLTEENQRLKNELKLFQESSINIEAHIDSLLEVDTNAKEFCKMLLTKKNSYNEFQKHISQNINYKSASCYNFLREDLLFHLPSQTSIYNWSPIKKLHPGFNSCLLKNLKKMVSQMDLKARQAVLLVDEITIRKDLVYNLSRDLVDGVQDLGNERNSVIGKQICVFMLRGLFSNWKYIISYFVTDKGMDGKILKKKLEENLEKCFGIELHIRGVVCDQGPNNRKCYRLLGVSKEKPYFQINEKKIIAVYDAPHLIKSVRNLIMSCDIISPDGPLSWQVIREIYNLDQKTKKFRMCPKLTQRHIYPSTFDKMNVNLAVQTLSSSVGDAIKACIENKSLTKSVEQKALSTSIFIHTMNKGFDCLNSKNWNEKNPYRKPLQKGNIPYSYLIKFREYLSHLKLPQGKKNYCLDGLIQTINGILMLSDIVFSDDQIKAKFLLSARLNQDPLENMFAQIRAKGGNNKNPSVAEFNVIVARLMSMRIVTFSFSNKNCENDEDILLDWNNSIPNENTSQESAEIYNDKFLDKNTLDLLQDIDNDENIEQAMKGKNKSQSSLADPAKRYFIGYGILKIIVAKLSCSACLEVMTKTDNSLILPSEQLIKYKNYNNTEDKMYLQTPSDMFFDICNQHFDIFEIYFEKYRHTLNIKSKIVDQCVNKTKESFPDWLNEDNICFQHRMSILDFLILVLLRKNCAWVIKNTTGSSKHIIHSRLRNLTE